MPWKHIAKSIGMAEGGTLHGLFASLGSALGMGAASGVGRAAFTAAVVALSAKLSKSDGVALEIEEETFERLFPVSPDEVANVRWLFRLASQDVGGFESYARDIALTLAEQPDLKRDVFEALLHIASADGVLHDGEDRYLSIVADIFGYAQSEYRAVRARFVQDSNDPYVILGVTRDLGNAELKAHYRRLVRENHPDSLASRGLGKELQDVAQRKIAAINVAWDAISKERRL